MRSACSAATRRSAVRALEALAAVTDDQLLQRVMKMLTSVASGPVASGEPGLGGDALVAHCVRVKPVVFKVYEKHRSSVRAAAHAFCEPELQVPQQAPMPHPATATTWSLSQPQGVAFPLPLKSPIRSFKIIVQCHSIIICTIAVHSPGVIHEVVAPPANKL